jgi:5-methylcytosine-specific restriction endonuclease McrA
MAKRYSELRRLNTFKERFDYLKLNGVVGESTFGYDRYINQALYTSRAWRKVRDQVIIRDAGCDLGISNREIRDKLIVHHINPISLKDIETNSRKVFDMENLICVSNRTHQAIHFGDENLLQKDIVERRQNDTIPWK